MSIHEQIVHWVNEGRLHLLPPLLPGAPHKRTMLVTDDLMQTMSGPWETAKVERRIGRLRADLDRFSEGRYLTASLDPLTKPKSTYMAILEPRSAGVWDIRSIDPKPGIRVLGCFSEVDTFVALAFSHREALGGRNDKNWRDFVETGKAEWRKLFPTYKPVTGTEIEEYISENAILV